MAEQTITIETPEPPEDRLLPIAATLGRLEGLLQSLETRLETLEQRKEDAPLEVVIEQPEEPEEPQEPEEPEAEDETLLIVPEPEPEEEPEEPEEEPEETPIQRPNRLQKFLFG